MPGGNKPISKIRQNRYTAAAPGGKLELNKKLKNKTILITGAAGGLGSELSFLCATAGCNTVMLDNDRKGLESTYDFITGKGLAEPVLYPIDLASATPEHFEEMVNALDSEFGGLDGLIHCAARFDGLRPLDQVSPPEWLHQMQVNINACWLLSVTCLPLLRMSTTGRLYFLIGSNPGSVGLAGQRVPIRVPRVRSTADREIPLRSYDALSNDGEVNDLLLKRVLFGISCRNYEAAAEAIPGAIGLSSSTVSRGFVQASAAKLREFQDRDLSGEDVVALFLDGKTFADETMVVALGITLSGEKRFLGFVETDTENAKVLTPFLRS